MMEFVGGPSDGESHDVLDCAGQMTLAASLTPRQMATYERRISPTTGQPVMLWVGLTRVRA